MSPERIRLHSTRARFHGWRQHGAVDHDTLVTVEWIGGPPSGTEWSDVQFILAETLRNKFDPRKIVKLEFRGIPDTENEYDIRCEILCRAPVRLFQPRFSFKSMKTKKPQPSTGVVKFTVSSATGPDLPELDAALRAKFNRLPLPRRIHLWQKYIASHFK